MGEQITFDFLPEIPTDFNRTRKYEPVTETERVPSDFELRSIGQLVLPHWDRGGRNELVLAQAA